MRFLVQLKIGARKSRSQFRNKLFAAVTFIAPAFAAKIAIEALRVFRQIV